MKKILTVAVLALLVLSVGYVIADEAARGSGGPESAAETVRTNEEPVTREEPLPAHRIIAYYFHGNARCPTCRAIESRAAAVMREAFGNEMEEGLLEWKTVNVQEPENEHFIREFELFASSLVLVETNDGETVRWKNLERTWELIREEGDAFDRYVREETEASLDAVRD